MSSQAVPPTKRAELSNTIPDFSNAISELAKRIKKSKSIQVSMGRGRNAGGHKNGKHAESYCLYSCHIYALTFYICLSSFHTSHTLVTIKGEHCGKVKDGDCGIL